MQVVSIAAQGPHGLTKGRDDPNRQHEGRFSDGFGAANGARLGGLLEQVHMKSRRDVAIGRDFVGGGASAEDPSIGVDPYFFGSEPA